MVEKTKRYFLCGSCENLFVVDLEYEVSRTINKDTGATNCIIDDREICNVSRVADDGRVSCVCGNVDSILLTTKDIYDEFIEKSKHE